LGLGAVGSRAGDRTIALIFSNNPLQFDDETACLLPKIRANVGYGSDEASEMK
jgi:hypothetical protein